MDVCKDIRIVNNLHMSDSPRFITYREYKRMNPNDLVNKLLRNHDFFLAFEISKYLKLNLKKVYQKFAIEQMKAMSDGADRKEEISMYERLQKKLQNVPNISYIKLAKKAFKYGKQEMGIKFLENEKSILTKIPQYIELKKWTEALDLAYQTYDTNVLITVIDKIMKNQSVEEFCQIVGKDQKINSAVIDYLKKNYPSELDTYLRFKENYEELFFQSIEKFFRSATLDDRKKSLREAKAYLEKISQNKNTTFDLKFYKSYVKDIENSIHVKYDFLKDDIIPQTDTSPFDNSIYDVFKIAIKKEKFGKVENKNKMFEISKKKINILRIRAYAEMKHFDAIDALYNNGDFKKLDLSFLNFAEVYIDYGQKDKAAEALKRITEPEYFGYKIELLKYIEKYADALEAIISDKSCEMKGPLVNEILAKHGDLKNKVNELCAKYKVQL